MAKISLADFSNRVKTDSLAGLIQEVLNDDDPWLFRKHKGTYGGFKNFLLERLEDPELVCVVVGSAKYGFSISPDTYGTRFHGHSDVDVALLSPRIFDMLWAVSLDWKYPWHTRKFEQGERDWALNHMEEHMAGAIDPMAVSIYSRGAKRIPQSFQRYSNVWFETFKQISNAIEPVRGRSVEGRVYRSVEHLHRYLEFGLTQVRETISKHN